MQAKCSKKPHSQKSISYRDYSMLLLADFDKSIHLVIPYDLDKPILDLTKPELIPRTFNLYFLIEHFRILPRKTLEYEFDV